MLPPTSTGSDKAADEVPPSLRDATSHGFLATLRSFEDAMDRRLGVESHGISRRLLEERDPSYAKWHNQAVMFLL